MTYETIQVDPLTPRIGAEIDGVDLSQPLGNQTFKEVHDALMEHQVIFFRDQDMDGGAAQGVCRSVRRVCISIRSLARVPRVIQSF